MSQIGRITWSRAGISIYDGEGSFVTRIEHEHDRHFFNEIVVAAMKKISEEQIARRRFVSDSEPAEVAGVPV